APARLGYRVGKFVRRHRGTVLAALLLVLSLVVGLVARSLEARRANRERAVAEQERAKAEDLAAFMLEDLWHSLAPEGQLKLLAPVAEKLRDYYAERAAEHDSPRVRRRHAEALAAVGNVLHEAGELEGAVRAYSDRLALLRSTAASPPDRDSLLAIAEALRDLASSQRDSLEQAGALLHLEQLRDLTGAWLLTHPDDQDAAFFAASAHDDRGIVLYDQQRLAAALDAFDRAAAHLARPPLAGLRDSATRDLRSQVDLHRGVVLQDLGRVEAARIALERSVEEADALWRDAPREIFRLRAMAFSRTVLAELLVEIERTDEASEIVSQVLPTLREAVLRDPGNAENRYVLANALETYARAHEGAGMADRAERARREIVEIAEPMAAGGDHVYLVDSYVRALLASGEVERAAPHARALLEQGWKHRGFRELCARYGLLVDGVGEPE
ncbi:MAG: hypothetical protein MI919_05380, partial [Holophagales bacterium]|nr:hypothetical protein [Holophagales bacterium]